MTKSICSIVLFLCLTSFATAGESQWISLFNGKDLSGWKANERPESWKVENGAIVTNGDRSHLFYVGKVGKHDFKNFVFSALVKSNEGANSGIYFHTKFKPDPWPVAGYEAQVYNSRPAANGEYVERKMTGSIYAVRNTWVPPVKNNEWFEYKIKVSGKTIQTFINGRLICEYTENDQPWRADDKLKRLLSSGTFAFQAHDPDSVVHFRDIKVKILPDDAPSLSIPVNDKEFDQLISQFSNDNVALIDLGIVSGSESTNNAQKKAALKYGLTLGYTYPDSYTSIANIVSDSLVFVINDNKKKPPVEMMKFAKANGVKIAFSSGGVDSLDAARLKSRLRAMKKAGIGREDIWIPGV